MKGGGGVFIWFRGRLLGNGDSTDLLLDTLMTLEVGVVKSVAELVSGR